MPVTVFSLQGALTASARDRQSNVNGGGSRHRVEADLPAMALDHDPSRDVET
jgi:hypothetical protein